MIDVDNIVNKGADNNIKWLNKYGNTKNYEYLYEHSKIFGKMFAKTNCEITAMMLRHKLSKGVEWKLLDENIKPFKDSYLFQVSYGSDFSEIEHIFTIYNGNLLHSFYKKHELKCIKLSIDDIHNIINGNIKKILKIVQDNDPESENHTLFYWLPNY